MGKLTASECAGFESRLQVDGVNCETGFGGDAREQGNLAFCTALGGPLQLYP